MALANFKLLFTFLASFFLFSSVLAQVPNHPLIEDGKLDSVTVTDSTKYNSGGFISVNGRTITVPDNLVVQFPAAWVNFRDFAAAGLVGNEVAVSGNVINGKPIAAQIQISQLLLQFSDGVIQSINNDGSMKIVGGPTIRINDPNGKFGAPYTANPLFTADDENPSIVAFSGFPMCIPRSSGDKDCPSTNRPAGQNTFQAPDPLSMAPFLPGDYIEYSGILIGGQIICYSITATSVMITTAPGTVPAYIRMEDANIGVYDPALTAGEFGDTKFVGFTSDPSVTVIISAIDVDPCTGEETYRIVGSSAPKILQHSHYTREYRIKLSTDTKVTNQGILAGQYVQPVTEWIFPEPLIPGAVTPPIDFSVFNFFANGFWLDGQQYGQLSPWPGTTFPAKVPFTCPIGTGTITPNASPAANAGPDSTCLPGSVVTLAGSNVNFDIADADLTYSWTQKSGPTVTLIGTGKTLSFTAPAQPVSSPIILRDFTLTISNKASPALTSTDTITITTDKSLKDIVTINAYTWTSTQGGTLSVTATTNYVVDNAAGLTLLLNPSTAGLAMSNNGNGVWSFSRRSTKKPAGGVTVKSLLGGSDTKAGTTAKKRRSVFDRKLRVV